MRLALPLFLLLFPCLLQGCIPAVKADAGVSAAQDSGNIEAYREDQKIETRALDRIYEQFKILIHVNVTSFKHNVLLSGEVPDETTKATIEKIVSGIEGVHHVYNELVISGNSSLASRSNDSLITSNVRMRFVRDKHFNAGDIKVVTENGTVFLMGNVKRTEGDAAAKIVSTTSRVQRVVKFFEYAE